eukprot:COSAG04_NODE_1810_length_5515_cov_6.783419_2_plen_56_part_00
MYMRSPSTAAAMSWLPTGSRADSTQRGVGAGDGVGAGEAVSRVAVYSAPPAVAPT